MRTEALSLKTDHTNLSRMVCEVGKDFRKIIRQLAREAASSDEWLKISPLTINNDRKGGAFSIMLQQFTRAIGIAIVLRIVKHKVG